MRNRAIFASDATSIRQESGQKAGRKGRNTPKEREQEHTTCISGHHHRPKERATTEAPATSKSKYILDFAPFGLRKYRENTKAHQKFIHFCPVLP